MFYTGKSDDGICDDAGEIVCVCLFVKQELKVNNFICYRTDEHGADCLRAYNTLNKIQIKDKVNIRSMRHFTTLTH